MLSLLRGAAGYLPRLFLRKQYQLIVIAMPAVFSPAPPRPTAFCRTARLTLRPYAAADAPDFFALLDHNRARLKVAFPTRTATTRTLAAATRMLATFADDWHAARLYVFGIWHTATGRYLGDISLRPGPDPVRSAEIGYYLDRTAEGHGYAREALAAAVAFGLTDLRLARLDIRCRADNPRSCAVAEANGFRQLPLRPRLWPLRKQVADKQILYYELIA